MYRPVSRAQKLILSRRTPLRRVGARRGFLSGLTPFQVQCLIVSALSLYLVRWLSEVAAPLMGAVFVLTAGAGMLLVDLMFDKFDVLADPREYQVIAAHPHDAWSVVLAKVMAIARGAAIMAACVFTAPAIAAGFVFHSVGAAAAFVLAAAALTIAVSAGGMLSSAAVVAIGGRTALQRLLPFVHVIYLVLYLGIVAGSNWIVSIAPSGIEAMGWLKWALPTVWFAAPVELATGQAGSSTLARGLLASGSLLVAVPLCARWVRTRFDERILEPSGNRTKTAARRVTHVHSLRPGWQTGPRAFWRLLRVHILSDTAVRGSMIAAFFMPIIMFVSTQTSRAQVRAHVEYPVAMMTVGFGATISLLARTVQLSTRPQAIWFVLISPGARLGFSRSVVWALRVVVLLPLTIAAVIYAFIAGQGPFWSRLGFVVLAAILCDLMLVTTRGFSPAIPFSRNVKERDRMYWGTVGAFLGLIVVQSLVLIAFIQLSKIDPVAGLIPFAFAILLRVGVGLWAGRRVEATALAAEETRRRGPLFFDEILLGPNLETVYLVEQRCALHSTEASGGVCLVASVGSQRLQDPTAFLRIGVVALPGFPDSGGRFLAQLRKECAPAEDGPVQSHGDRASDFILQLSDVAGPRVGAEERLDLVGDGDLLASGGRGFGEEIAEQNPDVLLTFAKRRDLDVHSIQPEKEVLPKYATGDQVFQVGVRRGDHAHVDRTDIVAAHAAKLALLENPKQSRLGGGRQLADLVQEDCSLVGGREETVSRRDRAGERAPLVPEELTLDQAR